MFGELPKLFDRNFAMAYFLPAVMFIGLVAEIASRFGKGASLISSLQADLLVGASLLGVISWLSGIFLLVTNRGLYRFLEGYGRYNPLKLMGRIEKSSFTRLQNEIAALDDQYREYIKLDQEFPQDLRTKRNELMRASAERFPDKMDLLLPTPFGNTLRAFEVYPRVMYGIESIDGWSRLLAIIPKEYRELMDNAKTQVDFWVNIGFLNFLLFLEYVGLAILTQSFPAWWILILLGVVGAISPYFAQSTAVEWGDYVKSAFDVFTAKLREALGIPAPADREEEKDQWVKYSQAIGYRLPGRLPEFKPEIVPEKEKQSLLSRVLKK